MSWLYSRALVVEYSEANCLDGALFVELKLIRTPQVYSSLAKMTDYSRPSRFGMMSAPLTESHGDALLMWYLAGFRAKPTARQLLGETMQTISGRKCDGSWQMSLPGTYLPRTSADDQLKRQRPTASRWVTKPNAFPYPRKTWVQTMLGSDIGYLHTPTCTANYTAQSMQKWPSARAFTAVFGIPTPMNHEWLMGWPIGWSDLEQLAMDKYQSWLQQHGGFF